MTTQSISISSEDNGVLSIAEAFVPLCSLKANYLKFLLQQSDVDYVCEGYQLFGRGCCDYRHIYLLHGKVKLKYSSGYTEIVSARENLFPLVNEMPRPCEAIADTDCTLLTIESERLDRILSWSQISQYLLSEFAIKRDYDEDIDWIQTVLNSNLFYKVPPVNAEQVLGRMESQVVIKGEVVLREGEIGHCCYFIKDGEAAVTRKGDENQSVYLANIGVGRCFGEDALVYETARNATVTMLTDGVLMRLEKEDFNVLLLEPKIEEVSESDYHHFSDAPVFIDVRTVEEYERGHLSVSANLPLNLLSMKKRLLRKEVPYILYCDTGRRSRAVAYLLSKQGYNTASLSGGLMGAGMQYQLVHDVSYVLKDGQVVEGE